MVGAGEYGPKIVHHFYDNTPFRAVLTAEDNGGMFLTDSREDANKEWSTRSKEDASRYQHEEIGYNYRMINIVAGVIRGQIPYLDRHIEQKTIIGCPAC